MAPPVMPNTKIKKKASKPKELKVPEQTPLGLDRNSDTGSGQYLRELDIDITPVEPEQPKPPKKKSRTGNYIGDELEAIGSKFKKTYANAQEKLASKYQTQEIGQDASGSMVVAGGTAEKSFTFGK